MDVSRKKVDGLAASRVKMRSVFVVTGIDRNKYTLVILAFSASFGGIAFPAALKNALLIRENYGAERTVIQRGTTCLDLCKFRDMCGEVRPFGLIEARSQCRIAIFFSCLFAPLGTVVHARESGHAECQRIDERQVRGIIEVRSDTSHVVIIDETHEVQASKPAPVLGTELLDQGVDDLKHVHAVEAAEKSLVAGVVRAGMAHLAIDPHLIVAMEKLAEKQEIRLQGSCETSQSLQKFPVEAVRDVES